MPNLTESDLVNRLAQGLPTLYGADPPHAFEVRSHGSARTDLCILNGSELVAVEAKLSHWRRAIAQASLNRCYADRSFIALHSGVISAQVLLEAQRWQIGVIAVADDHVVIRANAPRAQPDLQLREQVLASYFGGQQT